MLREVQWRTVQWEFNAAYHGSCAARRRLYTLTFSPRAVAAKRVAAGARSALVLLRLRGILSLAMGPSGAKRPTQNEQY